MTFLIEWDCQVYDIMKLYIFEARGFMLIIFYFLKSVKMILMLDIICLNLVWIYLVA